MNRRVVVTGMAGVSPIGSDWATVRQHLRDGVSGVSAMPGWAACKGLQSHLVAKVNFAIPEEWHRKQIRTMGRVSLMATYTAQEALRQARLLDHPSLIDGSCGVSYGSTEGSPPAVEEYFRSLAIKRSLKGLSPYTYIQLMSHTCAANMSQFFKIKGRIIPTCSACTSGSQGIGYGYEAIKHGYQRVMVGGGAEELHLAATVVFDIMYATSTRNKMPTSTPRPFDKHRDGLVIGEGAATLVMEDLEHAKARSATIYAEVVGFGTNGDGAHIVNPSTEGMETAMRLALDDAKLPPSAIGYVNAHGTATELGDIAETQATARIFGKHILISSLKSYMGHTLGACGALEAWMSIEMMREGWFAPTLNLRDVDRRCGRLDYIRKKPRELKVDYVMSNNFAFGGVNTSLIFRRWTGPGGLH